MKSLLVRASVAIALIGLLVGCVKYATSPTQYDFGNGARLMVPCGVMSVDQRENGLGVVVESGANVTVFNDSGEWRTLTVSYRKPDYPLLDTHAFEDMAPKSFKTFGANPERYSGMHISISDYAQKERDKPSSKM